MCSANCFSNYLPVYSTIIFTVFKPTREFRGNIRRFQRYCQSYQESGHPIFANSLSSTNPARVCIYLIKSQCPSFVVTIRAEAITAAAPSTLLSGNSSTDYPRRRRNRLMAATQIITATRRIKIEVFCLSSYSY